MEGWTVWIGDKVKILLQVVLWEKRYGHKHFVIRVVGSCSDGEVAEVAELGCVFATAASCTGCCVLLGFTRVTAETVASARSIVAISNAVRFLMAHYHYHYHYIRVRFMLWYGT